MGPPPAPLWGLGKKHLTPKLPSGGPTAGCTSQWLKSGPAAGQGQQSEYRPRKAVGVRLSSAAVSPATVHSSLLQNTGGGGGQPQPWKPPPSLPPQARVELLNCPCSGWHPVPPQATSPLPACWEASWQSHGLLARRDSSCPVLFEGLSPETHTELSQTLQTSSQLQTLTHALHQFWSNMGEQIGTERQWTGQGPERQWSPSRACGDRSLPPSMLGNQTHGVTLKRGRRPPHPKSTFHLPT